MLIVLIRLIEMIVSSSIVSSLTTVFIDTEIAPNTTQGVAIAFFIGMVAFIVIQAFQLRRCFYSLNSGRKYIIYNCIAYFFLALISAAVRVFGGTEMHMWTFCIYKFMMYANADMTWWQSAIYGHAVMLAIIFLAPIGVQRYDEEYDDDAFMLDEIDPYEIEYGADEEGRSPFEGEDDFDENADDVFFDEDDFDDYDDWE